MKPEDAEEYTESLGQIIGGTWRQIALAQRLGVPKALGLKTDVWVRERLGGYAKLEISERRQAVAELTAGEDEGGMGLSQRQAADVLGVEKSTVARDLGTKPGANAPREPKSAVSNQHKRAKPGANAPSEPAAEPDRERAAELDAERQANEEVAKEVGAAPFRSQPEPTLGVRDLERALAKARTSLRDGIGIARDVACDHPLWIERAGSLLAEIEHLTALLRSAILKESGVDWDVELERLTIGE